MSFKKIDMKEIEANKKKYAKEVKERWGNTDAYKECNKKLIAMMRINGSW